MISEPNLSSDGRALTWAAEQLGVPPESSPEVCTTAFLRRLAEEDFMPPPRLKDAWKFAAIGSSEGRPALPWLDSATETELSGRIEEFAGQFFNLPPEQRSAHWERLYADAQRWPRLETRLRRLKPGLTIEFTPLPALSQREAKLIQWIRELFTLPMDERAVRRRQKLRDDVGIDIRPWQKAAQRVGRRQRAIAALAPDLLLPLATWSQHVKAATRNRQRRKVAGVKWWRPLVRSGPSLFKSAPWAPVAIVLVSGLVRFLLVIPQEEPRYNSHVFTSPFRPTGPIDPETRNLFPERNASNPRIDLPPIDQPKPFDSKDWHDMLDKMEKHGQISNRAPIPPVQSPPLDPLLPKVPSKPQDMIPDKSLNEHLFSRTDSDSRPVPAAPAGQKR